MDKLYKVEVSTYNERMYDYDISRETEKQVVTVEGNHHVNKSKLDRVMSGLTFDSYEIWTADKGKLLKYKKELRDRVISGLESRIQRLNEILERVKSRA